jgi:acetate---CoA ligase (ADP-forming) subunit beta
MVRRSRSAERLVEKALKEGRSSLFETEAEQIARLFGIVVPRSSVATTQRQAVSSAKALGFPVIMKIVSPDILHKSDVGGVVPDVKSPEDVRASFALIIRNAKKANPAARIEGVLVQKMARSSFEFVVGGIRDQQFGPTVMFGLGGIYVELFKDVSFRLAPLTKAEAFSMMEEVKSSKILSGFRGSKPLDKESVARTIISVGRLMSELPKVKSLDINPLIVYEKGSIAVDVRIVL